MFTNVLYGAFVDMQFSFYNEAYCYVSDTFRRTIPKFVK